MLCKSIRAYVLASVYMYIGILVEISSNVCDFGGGMENSSHPLRLFLNISLRTGK